MMSEFEIYERLMEANRTCRRFDQSVEVGESLLRKLVGALRYAPSARNLQPMRYRLVSDPEECAKVFPHLKWAGYLKDWDGPADGERPTAYIVQCLDTRLTEKVLCDDGIHLLGLTLGATALGYGCCIIKAFAAPYVQTALSIPADFKVMTIIAIGKPKEVIRIEPMTDGQIAYWRDNAGEHHVPKRPLEELIINIR